MPRGKMENKTIGCGAWTQQGTKVHTRNQTVAQTRRLQLCEPTRKHAGHRRQTLAQPREGARRRNQLARRQVPEPGFRVSAEQLPGEGTPVRRRVLRGAALITGLQ